MLVISTICCRSSHDDPVFLIFRSMHAIDTFVRSPSGAGSRRAFTSFSAGSSS